MSLVNSGRFGELGGVVKCLMEKEDGERRNGGGVDCKKGVMLLKSARGRLEELERLLEFPEQEREDDEKPPAMSLFLMPIGSDGLLMLRMLFDRSPCTLR
eukprot:NODE_18448_length_345_cov_11.797297_g18131_i0.p3 GENE.NODE_18448_length_345_cov_11.797297_g18131_i0~~NODE_18448_length_345_cov_11.797297_g18131_i0.p3  ORF type:complete len:100 (+),score=14.22 NODE_18448_length_345_cov_11.797297_g18131_i0:43-342(+)